MSTSDFNNKVFRVTTPGRVTRNSQTTVSFDDWIVYLKILQALLDLPTSPLSAYDTNTVKNLLTVTIGKADSSMDSDALATYMDTKIKRIALACDLVKESQNITDESFLFNELLRMKNLSDFVAIFRYRVLTQFGWARGTHSNYTWYGPVDDVYEALKNYTISEIGKRESVSDHVKKSEKGKRESVSDDAKKLPTKTLLDYAKMYSKTNDVHTSAPTVDEGKRESVSDDAKKLPKSVSDQPITNAVMSNVAHHDYFKYRYDETPSVEFVDETPSVESVTKAIRAVNINIAICDNTNAAMSTVGTHEYLKYRYDDVANHEYFKYRYDDETSDPQDYSTGRYESIVENDTAYAVDHYNETVTEFDPQAYSPDRYETIFENDTAYVVDHYNEEIYEDIGCDTDDHSSLDNYEYYTDDESQGEENYWSDEF